ncbi:hypothetical protein C1H46_043279 [Malus baccata]|uniref:Peroxidase n=1 Tax=Malus baccata TaxID=106549 RepID=A0A540KAE0_MALBA|nr:hypothetical protein C1H46_043279 [Malus baccata]
MKPSINAVLVSLLLLIDVVSVCHGGGGGRGGGLSPVFYDKSCPQIDRIVRNITWSKVAENSTMAPKLLRMHYHDCFVRGCDASLLLDSTSGNPAEKEAIQNSNIRGYEVIDEIKTRLEEECPGIVSCADIVALVARDAVSYQVLTGRKDGKVSLSSEASINLPSAGANFTTLYQQFIGLGLNIIDLVALSGAHTIGVAHCAVFQRRLNVTGKGDIDPTLDPEYAEFVRTQCINPAVAVALDANSSASFDSHYFAGLRQNKGLLRSDAALLTDRRSAHIVRRFEKFPVFMTYFGNSMKKMGSIGLITREEDGGEIRKNCRVVNAN